jgi:DNA modification methylase
MDGSTFHLSQGDAVAWLRTLPSESVDLVITDPPYESLEKHRAIGTTTRLKHSKASSNDWFAIFPNTRFPELFREIHRVLAKNRHFYLYCDPETMFVAKPLAEEAGFRFWKPLIWDKCLGPDTPVWTERGRVRIDEVVVGDRVAIPEGGSSEVLATRRTRAPARRLRLGDGSELVASAEHRFVLASGKQLAAGELIVGNTLLRRPVRLPVDSHVVAEVNEAVRRGGPVRIDAIDDVGERDLIDISIADREELFLLGNGVVTHNCTIGMGYHYRARYECILFFEKGKRKLSDLGVADIIQAKRISGGYPAEKPASVSEVLVRQSSERGELVIDPFMGSGSVGVAAVTQGRHFRGNDLCAEAVEIARGRMLEAGAREASDPPRPVEAGQLGLL